MRYEQIYYNDKGTERAKGVHKGVEFASSNTSFILCVIILYEVVMGMKT